MKKSFTLLLFSFFCLVSYAQEHYSVYFDTGKDTLNNVFSAELKNWMDWHKSVNVIRIQGYADGVGKIDANNSLSVRRANTIKALFEKNGVTLDEKVLVQGLGEIGNEQGQAQNRKVIIYFEKEKPKVNRFVQAVKKAKKGQKLILPNLNFDRNSGRIVAGSFNILNDLTEALKESPNLKIDIQGHICCNFDDPKKLGILRAKAVYNYLIEAGVDEDRITYQSFGATRPIYSIPEQNAVQAESNRRVEIEILEN